MSSPSPSAEALARRPLITRLKPFRLVCSRGQIDVDSRDFGPLDSGAVVRESAVPELVIRYLLVGVRKRRIGVKFVGHQVDSATLVGEWGGFELDGALVANLVGDVGVQLDSDFQRRRDVGYKAKIVGFRPPAAQFDIRHNLGNALGASHPGAFGAGDTLLRLRHAAARHGCREQGQHDEAASPDWLLNLLHRQLSRRLAVNAAMHRIRNGRARAALAISGAIPHCVFGIGRPADALWKLSACRPARGGNEGVQGG